MKLYKFKYWLNSRLAILCLKIHWKLRLISNYFIDKFHEFDAKTKTPLDKF